MDMYPKHAGGLYPTLGLLERARQRMAEPWRHASCCSAIHRSTFAQSKSLTFVLTVTRVAATTPTMWATGFPEIS